MPEMDHWDENGDFKNKSDHQSVFNIQICNQLDCFRKPRHKGFCIEHTVKEYADKTSADRPRSV